MESPISVAEAWARIRSCLRPAPVVECPLERAAGRVLRASLRADRPLPPFDRVMMDGYAVRSSDCARGAQFVVRGRALAGQPRQRLPQEGADALEITTGSPLPEGADCVVPYEDTDKAGEGVFCLKPDFSARPGLYVHACGSDYPKGEVLLEAGSILGPVEAGIAASCGYATVSISQSPRLALLGTGDELVPVRARPEAHQIRSSNVSALENALALAGYACGVTGHLPDDAAVGRDALAKALAESDVVVLCGAVSRGVRDWIPSALDSLAERQFHGVLQKPGKPMGFWKSRDGCVVFGLPGNPVSALVGLHRYVLPCLQERESRPKRARAYKLASPLRNPLRLTWFPPVKILADARLEACPLHNSGDYARLAGTSGFIELEPGADYEADSPVPFFPWQS